MMKKEISRMSKKKYDIHCYIMITFIADKPFYASNAVFKFKLRRRKVN